MFYYSYLPNNVIVSITNIKKQIGDILNYNNAN